MSKNDKNRRGLTTTALHTGYDVNSEHGAIIPPLHLSTTFQFGNDGNYDYSRSGNPTRALLEHALAELDEADFALAYSSGSAALANITALLGSGEEILFSSDAYGGTFRYITNVSTHQGVKYHIVDLTDLDATAKVLHDNPVKLIWAETPTNPLLKVVDIAALAAIAHANNAILVVDNTFATPVIQKPLQLGADVVVYSTTKYINGHSDSIGGSLATNDAKLYEDLKFLQNAIGAILSPFDSWLTLRGLRTLELRINRHVENARALAKVFRRSDKVQTVYYPEFFTGAQGKIVQKQMALPGGMVSIELKPEYDVQKFLDTLKYFPLAESLGGVESLIDHPASMTHASIPPQERAKIGLSDGLFRVSVGIENTEDLVADVEQALQAIALPSENT
jgi:cystathionine beta-lyase/cystathionine gamma-synthase